MTKFDWKNRALHHRAWVGILVALIAGCGGGSDDPSGATSGSSNAPPPPPPPPTNFSIGGTVTGLVGSFTLRDNADTLTISADGAFTFPTQLASGTNFTVVLGSNPANQICTIANGSGTVNNANVSNVNVTCATPADVAISAIDPTHGKSGILVKITGSGFSPTAADNIVTLNNVQALVTAASATELTVAVPRRAGSGNFKVEVLTKSADSPLFTYDFTSVTVSTLAGEQIGFKDDLGTAAKFNAPSGVAFDPAGDVFVTDPGNHKIRVVNPAGSVGTIAGNVEGSADGTGALAAFHTPVGIARDPFSGNLFVSDFDNNNIRQVTPNGVVTTFFASGQSSIDLSGPSQLAFKFTEELFVVDKGHHRIIKLDPNGGGNAEIFAGTGDPGDVDGDATHEAKFQFPNGLAFCGSDLFVADTNNMKIRKISGGVVTTYTGSDGGLTFVDGTLAEAKFLFPRALVCDQFGKLFVVDAGNEKIRMITPSGIVTTLAGTTVGFADGDGATARFALPQYIDVDADGTLVVADGANNRIRKIVWE